MPVWSEVFDESERSSHWDLPSDVGVQSFVCAFGGTAHVENLYRSWLEMMFERGIVTVEAALQRHTPTRVVERASDSDPRLDREGKQDCHTAYKVRERFPSGIHEARGLP